MSLRNLAAAIGLTFAFSAPVAAQGSLNMLCAPAADWCEAIAAGFQRETGIRVNMTRKSAGEILAQIRAEAQKVFETYSDIEVTLTNLLVAVDADGTQATAVFDKEWSYETPKDLLESKARAKLRFQKSGAGWKIVSEKYQKIYYMEN